MRPDFGPAKPTVAVLPAANLGDRDRRIRQLEFEFGDELKSMTMPELVDRYQAPASVRDLVRPYPTYAAATRSPTVQIVLLEFLKSVRAQ
jgi:hypothetical protein